jgi:hypothetical protein
MPNTFLFHSSKIIRSFRTDRPRAVVDKIEGVVTLEATVEEALNLLFKEGLADVMILDGESGQLLGILSDPETTTMLSGKKKKKKKEDANLNLQAMCHDLCVSTCAARGGCFSHGVNSAGVCIIMCNDNREQTLGSQIAEMMEGI